jgi:hypothetical protein
MRRTVGNEPPSFVPSIFWLRMLVLALSFATIVMAVAIDPVDQHKAQPPTGATGSTPPSSTTLFDGGDEHLPLAHAGPDVLVVIPIDEDGHKHLPDEHLSLAHTGSDKRVIFVDVGDDGYDPDDYVEEDGHLLKIHLSHGNTVRKVQLDCETSSTQYWDHNWNACVGVTRPEQAQHADVCDQLGGTWFREGGARSFPEGRSLSQYARCADARESQSAACPLRESGMCADNDGGHTCIAYDGACVPCVAGKVDDCEPMPPCGHFGREGTCAVLNHCEWNGNHCRLSADYTHRVFP